VGKGQAIRGSVGAWLALGPGLAAVVDAVGEDTGGGGANAGSVPNAINAAQASSPAISRRGAHPPALTAGAAASLMRQL
jgi:hypothetical protein